ncbi:MAG: sulfotransferase [Thermodesulfobacteriota bacterium]|nr:sulfotransferase [Thermodesulfobacteriota bacterium]
MMKSEKIDLIYIASTGRSGSTLLEILLDSFGSIWTLGEIYVLPWEIEKNKGTCGCGKKLNDCEFWAPIISRFKTLLELNGNIHRFRDDYSVSKFFRFGELINILLGKKMSDTQSLIDFCSANRKLLSAVKKESSAYKNTEMSYLVDSSKIFYRLFWLIQCNSISIKVIHITKDPRSFVYSKIKNEKLFLKKLLKAFRMSLRYTTENQLIERVLRNIPKENALFIRYEDLATHPEKKLEEIACWLNLKYEPGTIMDFRSKKNHGIAGNIMRQGTQGVYLDEKWRINLSSVLKYLVILLTYFKAKKYSYL